MTTQTQIAGHVEICKTLTCLPEKFVVDFANGIDVTRDHLRIQRRKTGFFDRLYGGFSGQSERRQTEINSSLADGVEGALTWLVELTESVASTNYALVKVSERVGEIQNNVATLANYSADTRSRLDDLSLRLDRRCSALAAEIARVDIEQRATRHLDQVFIRWERGRFAAFSAAGQLFAVLEELRWGDFGHYCRSHNGKTQQDFIQDLTDRSVIQLSNEHRLTALERRDTDFWLSPPAGEKNIAYADEALTYLGDWSDEDSHPFVYSVTQLPNKLPPLMPRKCSAERVAVKFVSEVFTEVQQ